MVGLGRFVTEPVDEILSLLDHPLLVFVGSSLLFEPFLPKFQIFAIGDLVVVDVPEHDLDSPVRHVVQELPVMGDQQQCAPVRFQIIFQPLNRLNVKVIGRLVEQQGIRRRKQDLGKFDPHVPALAECLCPSAEVGVLET